MTQLEKELEYIKELTIDMMEMVKSQLEKSKKAVLEFNSDLAEEIVRSEMRVNAMELNIEKECENTIAIYQPVATDLRFILAAFKAVSEMERIGDHMDGIGKFLLDRTEPFDNEILKTVKIDKMFDAALNMLDEVLFSLNSQNSEVARKIFKKDKELNKLFRQSTQIISDELSKKESKGGDLIIIYNMTAKLERTGDLLTNIAEQVIFYLDAEIIKHKKKRKDYLKKNQ